MIELVGLTKRFDDFTAVDGVTLAVAAETLADPDSTPLRAESMPGVETAVAARPAGAVTPAELVSTLAVAAETSADSDSAPARAESMTSYIQRLGRLEKLALSLEGVQQAFAALSIVPGTVLDEFG